MACPSDRRLDLNDVEDADIWGLCDEEQHNRYSGCKKSSHPKDNRIFSKRFDELDVQDSLAFSIQCAGSVSNIGQHLPTHTRQVESLVAEVVSLKQEIRGLRHENRELHMLANSYPTSMKRKLDQLQESESRIQSDNEMFVALLQKHLLPSSSGVLLSVEVPNNQPPTPLLPGVMPNFLHMEIVTAEEVGEEVEEEAIPSVLPWKMNLRNLKLHHYHH
ncbi:unnamed protein product [Malus baccata var. baccata]